MSLVDRVRDRQRIRKAARASRLPGGVSADGLAPRPWWVDLRISVDGWQRLDGSALVFERIDLNPPAAGPEVQVTVEVDATSEAVAERLGRRLMQRERVDVLAARAYQRSARR